MKREVPPRTNRTQLWIASSPREAWDGAIWPWFQETLPLSWKEENPTVVVVPTRAHAQSLKQRLLESGHSHLGIQFVTPAGLRELLGSDRSRELAPREHLRLLLALAAEQENDGDNLAAKAVVRAPDHLLRTVDRLETAGWNFDELGLDAFESIVRRFREQLRICDFSLPGRFDRALFASSASAPKRFANLLLCGFDAAHWSSWFLLRAAINAAQTATVLLEYPRESSEIDLAWIGSWEEMLGEARPAASPATGVNDTLFSEAEMRGVATPSASYSFLVGADAVEQSEAVALLCARFLAQKNCTRLGVLFGRPGPLPRLVAAALDRLDLPHYDGVGHLAPGLFEAEDWRAWLELQRSPRIDPLLRLINALPNATEVFPSLASSKIEHALRDAYAGLLIDDVEVLREFFAGQAGEDGQAIAQAINSLGLLPSSATLIQFLGFTENAFNRLGWKQRWWEINRQSVDWAENLTSKLSRSLFLRWLEEIGSSFALERGARGDHPYARVQLLTVPQACGQEWSHLIFAGWNEGAWPLPASGEFMREDEIDAFNRKVRQLNRRAARPGRYGEGHESIAEGHTLYLGPAEQRRIALRQFDSLCETATAEIALTASLVDDSAPERLWNPNELFTRLYQQTRRAPLTERAMAELEKTTRAWLASESQRSPQKEIDVAQTRIAYDARRDPAAESGEYDFAFRGPAPVVPTLSVSDFENLLSAPALVWIKKYLGVRAPEEDASVWNSSTGKWIHDWLARIAGDSGKSFARLPAPGEIDDRICAAAREKRAEVTRLCQGAGRAVPDWWESGHRHALFLARTLGEKLAAIDDWPWLAAEWTIDEALSVPVSEDRALTFRGRIDLLLARSAPAEGSLAAEQLWIVDHKTGAKKPLSSGADVEKRQAALRKKLLDGTALQLGLYALAAQTLGARETWVSILSPLVRPLEPQLAGSDIAAEKDIFGELARMQATGQFGMHGVLRSAFRFTEDYPLATLTIDPDVLELRWEKTHPQLVREEEDIFW